MTGCADSGWPPCQQCGSPGHWTGLQVAQGAEITQVLITTKIYFWETSTYSWWAYWKYYVGRHVLPDNSVYILVALNTTQNQYKKLQEIYPISYNCVNMPFWCDHSSRNVQFMLVTIVIHVFTSFWHRDKFYFTCIRPLWYPIIVLNMNKYVYIFMIKTC